MPEIAPYGGQRRSLGVRAPKPHRRGRDATMPGAAGASRRRQVRPRAWPGPGAPRRPHPPRRPPQGRAAQDRNGTNVPSLPPGRHQCSIGAAPATGTGRPAPLRSRFHRGLDDQPPDRPDRGRAGGVPSTGGCGPQTPNGRAARGRPAATCHVVNVAAITSRRPELAGRLRDLSKTPLPGTLPFAGPDRGSCMRCVCHDPRRAGL